MCFCDVHLAEEEPDGGLGRDDPPLLVLLGAAQKRTKVFSNHKHVAANKKYIILHLFGIDTSIGVNGINSQDKIVYEPAKLNESTKHFNKSLQSRMKIKSFLFDNDFLKCIL